MTNKYQQAGCVDGKIISALPVFNGEHILMWSPSQPLLEGQALRDDPNNGCKGESPERRLILMWYKKYIKPVNVLITGIQVLTQSETNKPILTTSSISLGLKDTLERRFVTSLDVSSIC